MPECSFTDRDLVAAYIKKIILTQRCIRISLKQALPGTPEQAPLDSASSDYDVFDIEVPWSPPPKRSLASIENAEPISEPSPVLVQAITRAHSWVKLLSDGTYHSIEALAASKRLNPKVVRKAIRVAFLAPDITEAILTGNHQKSLTLTDLQKTLPLDWDRQRRALNFDRPAVNLQ
jgi:hypothetical protein